MTLLSRAQLDEIKARAEKEAIPLRVVGGYEVNLLLAHIDAQAELLREAEQLAVKHAVTIMKLQADNAKLREALEYCQTAFFFDLKKMRDFGPHYNQAIKDTGDRVALALSSTEPDQKPKPPINLSEQIEAVMARYPETYENGLYFAKEVRAALEDLAARIQDVMRTVN